MKKFGRVYFSIARNFSKRYSKDHEWVQLSEDKKECSIGISDYAQNALGGVVYLSYPNVGQNFKAHEVMGEIESPKAVSQIIAPLEVTISQINKELEADLSVINASAESTWLYKGSLKNISEFESLMSEADYLHHIKH